MPTRAHLLVLVLLVAVGRASTALLPSPLIVVVVRLERARADAATTRARATLRGVAIVEFALRAKPRLELRLWVVVLRGLRDPIHLVPVQVRHGTVIPAISSSARGSVVRSVRGSRVRRRGRRGTLKGLAGTRRGGAIGTGTHISWFSMRSSPSSSSSSSSVTGSRSEPPKGSSGSSSPAEGASSTSPKSFTSSGALMVPVVVVGVRVTGAFFEICAVIGALSARRFAERFLGSHRRARGHNGPRRGRASRRAPREDMEPSKRVVFVSLVGRDDGKPRTRRKRALGCVRASRPPVPDCLPRSPNGPPETCRLPTSRADPSPRPSPRPPPFPASPRRPRGTNSATSSRRGCS